MDTLNRLIEQDIRQNVNAVLSIPPLHYYVWIVGKGWLRSQNQEHCFAALNIEVARTAAQLYGGQTIILPADSSLENLQDVFLLREKERIDQRWTSRFKRWITHKWRGQTN